MIIPDTYTTSPPGVSSTRISRDDTIREQIDAAIRKHLDEITALRTQRNERAPISRLPAEIIANIFLVVKEQTQPKARRPSRTGDLHWIKVSHVCTAWRKIALNFAGLWAEPPLWNEHWAEEMIKRAKHSDLTIQVDSRTSLRTIDLVKKRLLSHKESVRELNFVNGNADIQWYGFWEGVPTGLVRLEKFRMSWFPSDPDKLIFLPETIFSGANKLGEVALKGCKMDWILKLPTSITTLHLDQVKTVSPLTWSQLITALEALQSLENLILADTLDSFSQIGYLRSHQVMFPRLRRLILFSSVDEATLFLRHVTFPSTASLNVNTKQIEVPPNCKQKVKKMLEVIGERYMHQPSDLLLQNLQVNGTYPRGITVTLQDPVHNGDSRYLRVHINFEKMGLDPAGFHDLLSAFFGSGLPMQDVHSASVFGLKNLAAHELAKSLGCLPNLSFITLNDISSVSGLAAAIGLTVGGESESSKLYFASLTTIKLEGVDFGDVGDGVDDRVLSILQESLVHRHECNAGISTLMIENCSQIDAGMVMGLMDSQAVEDIDWDGIEQGFESESESDFGE